ncbi:MAG: DUF4126 domain-containing protein [Vicinamibacterales bacterium]
MDAVPLIVGVLPFAFAAGLNLYATVAIVGLCAHFGLFALPAQFQGFDHPWVIGLALVLYAVEFVADKVPWVDTMWDVVHTFIRPLGGVVVGLAAVGQAPPAVQVAAALLGGIRGDDQPSGQGRHAHDGERVAGTALERHRVGC